MEELAYEVWAWVKAGILIYLGLVVLTFGAAAFFGIKMWLEHRG